MPNLYRQGEVFVVERKVKVPMQGTNQTVDGFDVATIDTDWLNFQDLVRQWHKERGVRSSIEKMARCGAYQTIIAMGRRAIPLILRQIESEGDDPDHWFWALHVIANDDPVPPEDRGDLKRMAAAWLDWGRRNLIYIGSRRTQAKLNNGGRQEFQVADK